MIKHFFMHVNNHANRKSFRKMTSKEKKKAQPSYTVAGIIVDNTIKLGVSQCSKEDSFCKETGRARALKNAQSNETFIIPEHILKNNALGAYFTTKARRLIK